MTNLEWALFYANKGWPVFPVHTPTGNYCSCGKPLGKNKGQCQAKHPRTGYGGFRNAVIDPAQIRAWWSQWPDANIGIPTGPRTGFFVVDLDDRATVSGSDEWDKLSKANGGDGSPIELQTGSGSLHLVYKHVEGVTNSTHGLPAGIDIRGDGGYIVAPPSIHWTGGRYAWLSDPQMQPSEPPAWLVAILQQPKLPDAPAVSIKGGHQLTLGDLEAFVQFKGRFDDERAKAHVRVAQAVIDGKSWAPMGRRYTDMFSFLGALRLFIVDTYGFNIDPASAVPVFAAAVDAVVAEGVNDIPDIAGMLHSGQRSDGEYRGKLLAAREEKATERAAGTADFERHIARVVAESQAVEEAPDSQARDLQECIKRAFGSDRTQPYTPDELLDMAPTQKRWLLGTTAGYFLRAPGGDYIGPFTRELLPPKARDVLAPAYTDNVRLKEMTDRGETRLLSMAEIMDRYGQVPSRVCYSYTVERSVLHDDLTFVQKAGRHKVFEPEYNPMIDRWLDLFAGNPEQAFALKDWLATLTDLAHPTSAVCIMGTSGAGKDLFANGLEKIWGSVMPFTAAIDHFNGGLIETPLVFANEEVRGPSHFKGSVAESLKDMIASGGRKVQNKYANSVDLYGAVRVILATNSKGILKFDRQPNSNDIQAIEDRILLLKPAEECRDYLIRIGGRPVTEAWVRGCGLARHVAWLKANRKVKYGPRFIVQGSGGMAEVLAADGRGASVVLRAYLAALLGPLATEPKIAHYWEGDFWFSPRNLRDRWATYGGKDVFPDDLSAVVGVICEPEAKGGKPKQRKVGGENIRMRKIKWPVLLRAAQSDDRLEELLGLKENPVEIK